MKISLHNAGKRFNREWIFRHITLDFLPGYYAITGANGSGKSTLLQVIAGALLISEGKVEYRSDTEYPIQDQSSNVALTGSDNEPNNVPNIDDRQSSSIQRPSSIKYPASSIQHPYKYLSIAAPYLDLIEEMTALEFLSFHSSFKKLTADHTLILDETGLSSAAHKQIRYFSSGMKQRLRLAQAFYSDTAVLLLDEPTTNLDADGTALYLRLIETLTQNRLVIISSNDPEEYGFCEKVIRIGEYK